MSNDNISVLYRLLAGKKLEPYIRHIRFPLFKNIEHGTKIEFSFPITALVGANGTNKSSILRALQGVPGYNNLGNYWFSTAVDPIEESPDGPHCFIYGYYNNSEKRIVEVLKTRIKKSSDPDYWEPSRPVAKYGMEKFAPSSKGSSKSTTRWDNITKNVIYIDFRQSLSAFDKYFYQTDKDDLKEKKAHIRKLAPHLSAAIKNCSQKYIYYKDKIIDKHNASLSKSEVDVISHILGKRYVSINIIKHSFFKSVGYTAVLNADGLNYTEAFAGSGEFAIVNLVSQVFSAPEASLILLDEPEVSLHPGAQMKLMEFLSDQIIQGKHQVILSTHSPIIIRRLPPKAVKVFVPNPNNHKIRLLSQESVPDEAFFYLGQPPAKKLLVIVEDKLAEKIVKKALRTSGEAFYSNFDVRFFPGGSKTLWQYHLPIFAAENRRDVLVLFDGDERPDQALPDPAGVSESEEDELVNALERVSGVSIKFNVDGGNGTRDLSQEKAMRRAFISWVRGNVDYLPGSANPEAFIWGHMTADEETRKLETEANVKTRFEKLARRQLGREDYEELTSSDILATQERCLKSVPDDNPEIVGLLGRLRKFLEDKSSHD